MKVYMDRNNKIWFYKVKKSDEVHNHADEDGVTYFNLESFIKKFNVTKEDFEKLNGKIKKISCGDVLIIPQSSKYCHIVLPTETISSIAQKYQINPDELRVKNKINKVFIGQKLFI